MTRFAIVVTALLASTSAFAGDVYDFKVGGQSVHIEQPRNCTSASCMRISIPGVYESGPRKHRRDDDDDDIRRDKKDADVRPAPVDTAPAASAPPTNSSVAIAPAPDKSLEPANGTAIAPESSVTARDFVSLPPPPASSSTGGLAPPVIASAPTTSPTVASASPSPLGIWLTEEKEGKVRIEACGLNLCGYSVDAKTDRNGEQVLINMKPNSGKWTGRIHDPKSGSNYDSTIAMKGPNGLRVQGCAFGGMFCGGQNWTRVN